MRNFLTPPPHATLRQAAAATAREAHNTLDAKLAAESGYRERAETGWEAAQQALDGVEAELQETRSKVATLEGKLSASEGLASSANTLRAQLAEANAAAQGERAEHDARMGGLIQAEKMAHMRADEALDQARQQAADEVAQLTSEHHERLSAATADAHHWRERAQTTQSKASLAASQLSAARGSLESMLTRLATAKSLAELSDLSRHLFESKARMLAIEDVLNKREGEDGQHGKGGGAQRRGGGALPGLSPPYSNVRSRTPPGGVRASPARGGARERVAPSPARAPAAAPPYQAPPPMPDPAAAPRGGYGRSPPNSAGRPPSGGRAVNGYYAAGAGYGKPPPPVGRPAGGSKIGAPPRRTGDNPRRSDGGVGRRAAAKGSRERDPGSRDVGGRGARAFR